jgi:plastocyanin
MKRPLRMLRPIIVLGAFAMAACGQNPQATEHARGLISGKNVVGAMTVILIVVAGAMVVGAIALDRMMKARRALAEAPAAVPEEEPDIELVAGIAVGRAPVPRWLYGFYVVIPVFALLYVLNAVALAPKAATTPKASAAPTGPLTKVTVTASGIKFDATSLTLKANSPITVTFINNDTGVPHNFTVWPSQIIAQTGDTTKAVKVGNTITGVATTTESFKTGPPGKNLFFECTIHPTSMFGNAVVA